MITIHLVFTNKLIYVWMTNKFEKTIFFLNCKIDLGYFLSGCG